MFSDLYARELERNFDVLLTILTPLGLLVVGNMVLLMATAMLFPFFWS